MKSKLVNTLTAFILLLIPGLNFGQAPALGTAANFELFTSVGAVSNTGISHITGHVGTNSGSSTGFGNVNGVMHDNDGASALCSADLTLAYNQLNSTVPTFFPAPLLGNGQILNAGVYSIASPATLNLDLTLDGQGNPAAVFIFQIQGAFSTNANAKVKLINGALACNVFWKIEGLVSMAPATTMRGTIVANNAAINMSTNDTLEGRALSTAGAITIDGTLAYTPIGCGSPVLTGAIAPLMGETACYTLFSSIGPVTNAGVTNVTGDIGSDNGTTTGFNPLLVVGAIHGTPDGSTALCSADLINVYNYLNTLPYDIELLYPAQFGNNLVLTPHTYLMTSAATFTDTLYLNAEGNPNAVFVIQINGALSTSTYSKVNLINGAQAKNVFWKVEGAVSINDYSVFRGTIICNNGAISLTNGVYLDGRALTTTGAVNTAAITAIMPPGCGLVAPGCPQIVSEPLDTTLCEGGAASFSVVATGSSLVYQWRKGNVNLINGGNISGANSSILVINPANVSDTAYNYNVVITGTCLPNDTSANAGLMINTAPVISTQPLDQIVCAGNSANFSVTANGTGISYQWRKGIINLINGGNISGATSSSLTINPANLSDTAYNYNVIISGGCLPNDTSVNVSLMINVAPVIITEPINQAVCAGSSVSFSVNASGTGLLSYQWRKGIVNLINGGSISGVTSSTLTINPVNLADTAYNYNVIISGPCSLNDTSINVSLMINTAPIITTEPISQTVCAGAPVNFSVIATGTGLSYQWRKGITNLINGGNISGATSSSLTINPTSVSDTAYNYNVVITGPCSPNDTSSNVSLMVNTAPSIIAEPVDQIVCAGSSVSFSVNAAGTGLSYQWRKGSVNLVNGGNISGATTSSLTINPANISDTASNYNVVITGLCLPNDTSLNVSLLIYAAPVFSTQPSNQTACAGSSVNFSVNAIGSGLSFQWRKGIINLINGSNISGATSSILTINPVSINDTAYNYNVVITGMCSLSSTSINVSLDVKPTPVAIANSNSPACSGNTIYLTAQTVAGATYQWTGPAGYSSTDQNPSIISATIANAGNYDLIVSTNGCASVPSIITVLVDDCSANADLSVVKTANNMHPFVGNTIVFTIIVTNNGPATATNVEVTDILQSGYSYMSSTNTAGIYDPSTGVWTIGTLNSGTTATLTINATVNSEGNYVNTAIVYGYENDNNMLDNVSSIEPIPTDFFIPEGFSPNADGINDLFVIRGIYNYPDNTFVIFNRWGDKVFEASPYQNTWDGKCQKGLRIGGDDLPIGTYFYLLDLKDGSEVFKGTIYLNK